MREQQREFLFQKLTLTGVPTSKQTPVKQRITSPMPWLYKNLNIQHL
jgi:hypothetical protein